jgi:hypothetical protein
VLPAGIDPTANGHGRKGGFGRLFCFLFFVFLAAFTVFRDAANFYSTNWLTTKVPLRIFNSSVNN